MVSSLQRELVKARRDEERKEKEAAKLAEKKRLQREEKARKDAIKEMVRKEKAEISRRAMNSTKRLAAGYDGSMASADPAEVERIFKEIDEDGSGFIDNEELGRALELLLGKRPHKKVIADVMVRADLDGNGASAEHLGG